MNCKKATYLTTKQQEGAISFVEGVQLKFHVLFCKYCSLFKTQTDFLDKNIANIKSTESTTSQLDDSFKKQMEEKLKQQIKDNN